MAKAQSARESREAGAALLEEFRGAPAGSVDQNALRTPVAENAPAGPQQQAQQGQQGQQPPRRERRMVVQEQQLKAIEEPITETGKLSQRSLDELDAARGFDIVNGALVPLREEQGERLQRLQEKTKSIKEEGADDRKERLLRDFAFHRDGNPALKIEDFCRHPAPIPPAPLDDEGMDEDAYIQKYGQRPFVDCSRDRASTFAMDVDTASYARARALLQSRRMPAPESIRVEEFVNAFKQSHPVPQNETFGVFCEGAPSPFGQGLELLKVGIQSRDPRPGERKPAMLTFVVDCSGSMARRDTPGSDSTRMDLVKGALKTLVALLRPDDALCIVAFGSQAELVLPRTAARHTQRILDAVESLTPGGATHVEAGLSLGYRLADEAFSAEAVNRVILCSDGVANVGPQGPDEILKLVKVFAGRGIDLCTVGIGLGTYNDTMMEKLANQGNGSAHFVDSLEEAEKIFKEQLPPSLDVLARDAKVQVEFNPEVVERYRLLGYENRRIADKDFRNDAVDAGEVAHSTHVTALYEIRRRPQGHGPLGKVFLRWKDAGYRHLPVVERNYPIPEGIVAAGLDQANPELRFVACVAEFAELLRGNRAARDGSFAAILEELRRLPPAFHQRPDWIELDRLVRTAQELTLERW